MKCMWKAISAQWKIWQELNKQFQTQWKYGKNQKESSFTKYKHRNSYTIGFFFQRCISSLSQRRRGQLKIYWTSEFAKLYTKYSEVNHQEMLPTKSQEIQRSKLSREAYNKVKTFSNYFTNSRFLFNPIERERKRGKRSETHKNTVPESSPQPTGTKMKAQRLNKHRAKKKGKE